MFNKSAFLDPKESAVLVVDLQNDFTEYAHGSLAVTGADKKYVDETLQYTEKLKKKGLQIIASQDWHPEGHSSFVSVS